MPLAAASWKWPQVSLGLAATAFRAKRSGLGVHLHLLGLDVLVRRRDDVGDVDHGPRGLPEGLVVRGLELQGRLVVLEGRDVVELGVGRVALPDVVGRRLGQGRPGDQSGDGECKQDLLHFFPPCPLPIIDFAENVKQRAAPEGGRSAR